MCCHLVNQISSICVFIMSKAFLAQLCNQDPHLAISLFCLGVTAQVLGFGLRSSLGLIELRFEVKVRVSCRVSASLRIREKPRMADPRNGSPSKW